MDRRWTRPVSYTHLLLVILNDNGMSITANVGGVAEHLAQQRLKPQYLTFKKHYRRIMGKTWVGQRIYQFTHRVKKALKQSLLPCSMFENMEMCIRDRIWIEKQRW